MSATAELIDGMDPKTPEECRELAVEHGRLANAHMAARCFSTAGEHLRRAKHLSVLAIQLEGERDAALSKAEAR